MTPDALRAAFLDCLRVAHCDFCARPLIDEAVWLAGRVVCPDCGQVHGEPTVPRAHATWRPETARMLLATNPPALDGGP